MYFKDLHFSPNNRVIKSKGIRWDGYIPRIGHRKVAHGVLVGRPERRRPLGRRRREWADNIKKHLRIVGRRDKNWNNPTQCRDRRRVFVNAVIYIRVPCNAGNFLIRWWPVSSLGRTNPWSYLFYDTFQDINYWISVTSLYIYIYIYVFMRM